MRRKPGRPPFLRKMAKSKAKNAKLARPAEMAVMIKDPVKTSGLPGIRG